MKRSKFNLTHMHSTTADAGQLIPFFLQPTLPGDRFRIGLRNFIRCQPMVAPLMHEVYFYTQYWYIPYRILWDNWEVMNKSTTTNIIRMVLWKIVTFKSRFHECTSFFDNSVGMQNSSI